MFSSHGPNLYGTEPLSFYIDNLLLNMNVIIPFALFSLPALFITHRVDFRRLGDRAGPEKSSPYTLLAVRLLPMYVWFAIFGAQPHKEERFMFPVYPLICFNAAVCLYLVRGWMETAYVAYTKSPYRVSAFCLDYGVLSFIDSFLFEGCPSGDLQQVYTFRNYRYIRYLHLAWYRSLSVLSRSDGLDQLL